MSRAVRLLAIPAALMLLAAQAPGMIRAGGTSGGTVAQSLRVVEIPSNFPLPHQLSGICTVKMRSHAFLPNPEHIVAVARFSSFTGSHNVTFTWFTPTPAGVQPHVYAIHTHRYANVISGDNICDGIRLTGPMPGTWEVDLFVDNAVMLRRKFTIPPM